MAVIVSFAGLGDVDTHPFNSLQMRLRFGRKLLWEIWEAIKCKVARRNLESVWFCAFFGILQYEYIFSKTP